MMGKFTRNLTWKLRNAICRGDTNMALACLRAVEGRVALLETTGNELIDERDEIIANLTADQDMWRSRAIKEARWRIGLAKAKNRLITINQNLKQCADKNFTDWLKVSEDRALWKTSHERVVQTNEELITAIQRLPEPPSEYGDGPDERVGWILELLAHYREHFPSYEKVFQNLAMLVMENEELKRGVERNLRAAQRAETKLSQSQAETWCLRGEAGKVHFLDASFDIKQRLVVAEAALAAIRERAERIQEGEIWNLVSFVLKKIPVQHTPECWKNQSYLALGVGGHLASCTCGAEKKD